MTRLVQNITAKEELIPEFSECMAKTEPLISVVQHSENVAEVARQIVDGFSIRDEIKKWGTILVAIHDAGKISPGFQFKYFKDYWQGKGIRLLSGSEENHAVISEASIRSFINEICDRSPAAEVAGIHHGKRENPISTNSGTYGGERWSEERRKFLSGMVEKYGQIPTRDQFDDSISRVLAGFVTISDWIGSDENFFTKDGDDKIAAEAVRQCGFIKPEIKKDLSFKDVFGFEPYLAQKDFFESVTKPGVYIFESSTGSGKTEAALYATYKLISEGQNSGLYFALPTKLTSDKIHERVQSFVSKISVSKCDVMLAHGSAWLNDKYCEMIKTGGVEFKAGGSWFTPKKRTLLASFGVGTIDQSLMAVMNVKHFFVRAFGLAGKVVIFDEVHSYDMYTGTILDKLIEFLGRIGCTVIILSATLTSVRRKKFIEILPDKEIDSYPLITFKNKDYASCKTSDIEKDKEVFLSILSSSDVPNIAVLVIKKALNGQSVLWINNTVAAAQNSYRLLKSLAIENGLNIGLLHSKYTIERRRKIEDEWMRILGKNSKIDKGSILVATQVVEQSVDIDADFIVTELAPIDMLIQRIGRLWRHERKERKAEKPEVVILTGDIDKSDSTESLIEAIGKSNSRVYHPFVLWRTYYALKGKERIALPSELKSLLESVYAELTGNEPKYIKELHHTLEVKRGKLERLANASMSEVALPVLDDDEEKLLTRHSDIPSVECLIVKSINPNQDGSVTLKLLNREELKCSKDENSFYITKELHKNTVTIARYNFMDARFSLPEYLSKHFYGNLAVLTLSDNSELVYSNSSLRKPLFYTDELGVFMREEVTKNSKINYQQYTEEGIDYEHGNY